LLAIGAGGSRAATRAPTCTIPALPASYVRRVNEALLARRDVWGEAVLRAPGGPSYAAVRSYLKPLLLVGRPAGTGGRRLTDSGVYYLAFGRPGGPVALHVADGGEIISGRADGPRLRVFAGNEPYGSCLARLATPRLGGGYLPILQTTYADAAGGRYRQESFATRIPETQALVSFVRLTVPAGGRVRLEPSATGLTARGNRLVRGGNTYLFFSPGGRFDGRSLVYRGPRTVYLARLERPAPSRPLELNSNAYAQERGALAGYWQQELAAGTIFSVPDLRVVDAERNLLIQNLLLGWRYSVGNDYETFEFPESLANATVLGEYGFGVAARAIVEASFLREPHLYPNWEAGERLLEAARYERLFRDDSFLTAALPFLRGYVNQLAARVGERGLLPRERYASDLPDSAYSLNGQAVDLQGLRAAAGVLAGPTAAKARNAAARLAKGLRAALRDSERRLSDGSLFVPVRLLDDESPYDDLTASREGSYWNLVIPDALASGLIPPGSSEAAGVLRYLLAHGSRLLGLLRFNYYPGPVGTARTGGLPGYRASGSDDVYNLSLERFLADNHQADLLGLTLYGELGAGMTENTYVSGEGATIAPVPGEVYRSLYLPPNSTANAAFLECLRLMLIHETADGLELAYGTPRRWLGSRKRIVVREAPTSFGPVSFSIAIHGRVVEVGLSPPSRSPVRSLSLRLRLPTGEEIAGVRLNGHVYTRFDRSTGTIDLTGKSGALELTAQIRRVSKS
jgi:hypothetical protein